MGRVYKVNGEVCRHVGKGCGEGNGGDVGTCIEVWGPNTLLIPHISSLPSPFPAFPLTFPTPHHTFLHLLSYLFPHLPPHPNTFSYYPYITLHFFNVWRSYWQPVIRCCLIHTSSKSLITIIYWRQQNILQK